MLSHCSWTKDVVLHHSYDPYHITVPPFWNNSYQFKPSGISFNTLFLAYGTIQWHTDPYSYISMYVYIYQCFIIAHDRLNFYIISSSNQFTWMLFQHSMIIAIFLLRWSDVSSIDTQQPNCIRLYRTLHIRCWVLASYTHHQRVCSADTLTIFTRASAVQTKSLNLFHSVSPYYCYYYTSLHSCGPALHSGIECR